LTWGSPVFNTTDTVIVQAAPNQIGFHFNAGTAHLFAFTASNVGVQSVPEPSSMGLALIGFAGLMLFNRRQRKSLVPTS
jgi:hypothetical protein